MNFIKVGLGFFTIKQSFEPSQFHYYHSSVEERAFGANLSKKIQQVPPTNSKTTNSR